MFQPPRYAFQPINRLENLVAFEDGSVKVSMDKLAKFFSKDYIAAHIKLDVAHKVGMLLYGPPGTGKTSCAQLIMNKLVRDYDAVCLIGTGISTSFVKKCVNEIRLEQDSPIIVFVDEFENLACNPTEEQSLLTFLDGSDSVRNLIYLACTNYLDKIPDRIKCRPSRIKHLIEINKFPDAVYNQYISTKIKVITSKRLAELVVLCGEANLTIDQVKHVLINVEIEKMSVPKAIKAVKNAPVERVEEEDDEEKF